MQAALEQAFASLTLGPEPSAEPAAFATWARARGLDEDDVRFLCEAGPERLLVYRRLVRGTLEQALRDVIPRTLERLGPLFDEYFSRFLRERGSRSRYLRDVAGELLDFCEPLWAGDPRVPAWLAELGRHEALGIELAALPAAGEAEPLGELALTRALRFVSAARVARYRHAVHELGAADAAPPPRPTALFGYRDREHAVRWLELTPLAAGILERLLRRVPLGEAIRDAASELSAPLDPAVLEGTARLLADLAERGALLGAEP